MQRVLIWYGELIARPRLWLRGGLLLVVPVVWLSLFLLLPSVVLAALGFAQRDEHGSIVWELSLENFRRLAGFGLLEWSGVYMQILGRTLMLAGVTTALSVVLAYPLAFFVACRPRRTRYLWLALVVVPLCTNLVIRTYAWMLVLSRQMPPARLAAWAGLIPEDTSLYPGTAAVYIGMISSFLPFAVLPLYTSIERLDWSIVEAAHDLYGSRRRIFLHAILPQTLPGLSVAIVLTFIPAMGVFVVPDLLGGAKDMLVGNLIQQQFGAGRDWPFGAAISLGLMLLSLTGLFLLRRRAGEVQAT